MEMGTVNVEKSGGAFTINKIDETGLRERTPCLEIRGAVVLPDALNRLPGYFLLLGIKAVRGKYSLIFLTESEEVDPKALISTLVRLETKYRFHAIYTGGLSNITPDVLPDRFFIDLHTSFKENIPWVRLYTDPYADNISVGINLIARLELEKGFEPPLEDNVLRQQLNNQQIGELPGSEFYGVHALRHILGGFSIHKRLDIKAIESHREAALRKKTLKSLTGCTRAAWAEIDHIRETIEQQEE
jgi:hypothetical protein